MRVVLLNREVLGARHQLERVDPTAGKPDGNRRAGGCRGPGAGRDHSQGDCDSKRYDLTHRGLHE